MLQWRQENAQSVDGMKFCSGDSPANMILGRCQVEIHINGYLFNCSFIYFYFRQEKRYVTTLHVCVSVSNRLLFLLNCATYAATSAAKEK